MSEATTIDKLSIEIESNSSNAAKGINELATALGNLKSNGSIGVACRNLERLSESLKKLDSLSIKKVAIQNNFNTLSTSARNAGDGVETFGKKVNTTTLNLASMVTVIQGVKSALMPFVRLFSTAIGDAMEWDGISYQFGNAFGEQADEYAQKITEITDALQINKQTFMENSAMATSMLKGFGVGSKDAMEMGVGYTELAYDIWAAYNNVYKTLDGADGAMAAVRSAISGEVEPIRRAGFTIVDSQLKITAANHGIAYSSNKATEAQKSYLRYLTLVDQARTKGIVGAYAYEMKMNTAEALTRTLTQQVKSLSQAFGSLFLPILVKIMPWLQAFITLLTEAIYKVAAFFGIDIQPADWSSGIGGGVSGLEDVGGAADTAADSLGDTAGSAGKAKKAIEDLKKATLGIDELNVISPPTDNGGSGGSGGSGAGGGVGDLSAFEGLDVGSLWDQSIFDQIQFEVDEIIGKVKEALSAITAVISGFMLAIGTILVVSGANIPLGLALMAVGAVGLVATIAENWNGMSDKLAKVLTAVTAVLGGFLLAVGAILAFSGVNVGLGVALMAAGAVSLATAATINWKFLNGDMDNALSIMTGIVSGSMLAIGALFAFTGVSVGLGIALMAAGAVGLATAVGLNWDAMTEPMRKAVGTLEMIVGSALLSFGAILAFSGVNIPLGIAMIAAGAVSMVAAERLNWDSLNGEMENRIATLTALVSGATLGIGAVLAFSGVATGLGIALIAAGAVGIISSAPVNWSYITEKVKGVLKEIGGAVGISLLALGAVLAFSGVSMPIGISLMAAGAISLISAAALNWSYITTTIKGVLADIGMIAGTALMAIGLILVCSGVGVPVGLALLASGAAVYAGGVAMNWGKIVNDVNRIVDDIGKAWDRLWTATKGGIVDMWNGVVEWFTDLWDTLVGHSIVPDTIDGIVNCFKSLPGKVLGTVSKFVKDIVSKFSEFKVVQVAVSLAKKGWTTIKGWIGSIPSLSQLIKLGKSGWSSVKKWVGSIPAVSQAVKLAKSGWSSVKKWVGNIPTLSQSIKLAKSGWSSIKKWLGIDSAFSLKFKLPKIGINWGSKEVLGFKISYPKSFYTYAKGGFPDVGEMFIAREAGPEMVGRIGSKTTVANNDQIVEGISEGVYQAVLAAMKATEGNGTQSVNVYLDGKRITSSVEKHQRERGSSLMGNAVYAY